MNYIKCIWFLITLCSISAKASDGFRLENASITYSYPEGVIFGESFTFRNRGIVLERDLSNSSFSLTRDELNLTMPGAQLVYRLSSDSSLASLEYFDFELEEVDLSPSSISLSIPRLKFLMQDGLQSISNLKLTCSGEDSLTNPLASCLNRSDLSIRLLKIDKKNQKELGRTLGISRFSLKNRLLKIKEIRNLNFSVVDNKFHLKFRFKFLWNLRFFSVGSIIQHPDNSELEIKISSFKFLWFDVKKYLIKALRNQRIDNLRVVGNSIILKTKV